VSNPLAPAAGPALRGRRALVTGASRGIGEAVARRLAGAGADVVVGCRRHPDEAAVVAEAIRGLGRRAEVVVADLTTTDGPARLARAAIAALGGIDLLVLNAGEGSRGLPIGRTSAAEVARHFQLHAGSAHQLLAELLPGLQAAPRADVVAISSVAVVARPAGGAPYTMAKAALEALMATLAAEEGVGGVQAHVVAPGLVATEQGRRLVRALTGGAELEDVEHRLPGGRALTADDVASAVLGLVSASGARGVAGRLVLGEGPDDLESLRLLLRGDGALPGGSQAS